MSVIGSISQFQPRPELDKVAFGSIGGATLVGVGGAIAMGTVGMALGGMNGPGLKYPGGVGALGGALIFGGIGLVAGAIAGGGVGAAVGGIVELLDKD